MFKGIKMNIKKQMILFALTIFFCFKPADAIIDTKNVKINVQNNLKDLNVNPHDRLKIADYAIQLASIVVLNSKNANIIKYIALPRMILNALYSLARLDSCIKGGIISIPLNIVKAFYTSDLNTILKVLFAGLRARNVKLDYDIFKASKALAETNKDAENDITRKQQWRQALWLTANKIGPFIMNTLIVDVMKKSGLDAHTGGVWALLAEVSELYRQNIMYKMMKKQKLVAAY